MSDKFEKGLKNWQAELGLVRDAVRQELVSRQLLEHLSPPSPDVRVLDIGSGQGTQANHLADLGYTVIGIEPSEKQLEMAVRGSQESPNPAKFLPGTLEDMPAEAGGDFDVVCCHGVLMYLPELETAVRQLASLVRTDGLISVLTRNRASIAMRAGMQGDWPGAIEGFDARYYENRIGIKDVRADEPEEVVEALRNNNAELIAWYGVRFFTDHWGDQPPPDDFEQLIEAEFEAGRRDPYRQLASLTHVIAQKRATQ